MVNKTIKKIFYADCDHMNLVWESEADIIEFDRLWNEGICGRVLAKRFKRTLDEIAIHAMDRKSKGKIRKRKNGIWGDQMKNKSVNKSFVLELSESELITLINACAASSYDSRDELFKQYRFDEKLKLTNDEEQEVYDELFAILGKG